MKNTLIVNLYGGPGVGKSTGAAYIFAKMKMAGVDAEYVTEAAKDKVWEGNKEAFKCQFYLSGKQAFRISRCFGKVDVIVTDSPIMLGKIYADRAGRKALGIACADEAVRYLDHSVNIVLARVKEFNQNGRNENAHEACVIDDDVRAMLREYHMDYIEVPGNIDGYDRVCTMVLDGLKREQEQAADKPKRSVVRNGIYKHFKGKYYLVEDVARHSETGEPMVVYRHLYGNGGLCVRPVEMFLSEVDRDKYPDVKQKYRFELVNEFKECKND